MEGSDPHREGFGVSNLYGFEGPRAVWSVWVLQKDKHTLRTSNLGFQLTQLSQWEGRRGNGKAQESARTVVLNNVGSCT